VKIVAGRIALRIAALAAALAVSYGAAALLPAGMESGVGFVAVATVLVGAFIWALRDGTEVHLSDAVRDWLVVSAVIGVLWRVSLVLFEGSEDVVTQIRLEFLPLLSTIGLIFVPALVGALLGSGVGSAKGDRSDEVTS
jgi:hypothetical protein